MALLQVVFPALYRPGNIGIISLVGLIFGLALVLVARERKRYRTAAIDHTSDIAALRNLPWGEFEVLVGEVFRNQSFVVKERGGFKRDGGVDLIAERGSERVLIQCKHWRLDVREAQIKQLYADVKTQKFTEGWLVTSGQFSRFARSWAKGKEIKLIDGEDLLQLIPSARIRDRSEAPADYQTPLEGAVPNCANCGTELHRMTNRYDLSRFWGCQNPDCNWTFDDPPRNQAEPTCSRGHAMILRKTANGTQYWSCTHSSCSRKRLFA
jgi:restriction system protein